MSYPIIEVLCGGVFVLLYSMDGLTTTFMVHSLFFVILLPILVIDWEHLIIPNGIIVCGSILGIAASSILSIHALISAVVASLLAGGVMFAIRWIGNLFFKKETMGMGDVKLSAMIGLFIGVEDFLLVVWAAAVFGCVYWLALRLLRGGAKDLKLPFGSFLSLASFAVLMIRSSWF